MCIVLAVNHILEKFNVKAALAPIARKKYLKGGGNNKKRVPALQRDPELAEQDSSSDDEVTAQLRIPFGQ